MKKQKGTKKKKEFSKILVAQESILIWIMTIAFIGLAVPHMARLILGTENHRSLLPVTILMGGVVALLCNLICVLPGENGIIPLNAVTPIVGAPVIIYVIISQRNGKQMN